MQPKPVTEVMLVFPTHVVADYMIPLSDIPKDYPNKKFYTEMQQRWFFQGLALDDIPDAKEGIDETMALRHLQAIQRSFEPKHEHKQACVAYLMSLWFCDPGVKTAKAPPPAPVKPKPSKGQQKRRR